MHFKLVYFHCSKKSCKLPPDPWIISLVYKVIRLLQIRHNHDTVVGKVKKNVLWGFEHYCTVNPTKGSKTCSSLLPELVNRHAATNKRSSIEYTFAILGECRFEEVLIFSLYT